jgi:hypothetical protein
MDGDSTKLFNNTSMEDLDNSSWIPRVRMVAEFATSTLNGNFIWASGLCHFSGDVIFYFEND